MGCKGEKSVSENATVTTKELRGKLNDRQWKFACEYLKCNCNATKAAIAAGYSEKTAHTTGWENLQKPKISRVINGLLANAGYTAEYIKSRLQGIAEVDAADFEALIEGKSLRELRAMGVDTRLVKKFRVKRVPSGTYDDNGKPVYCDQYEVEFLDPQKALEMLAKCHKLFAEGQDGLESTPGLEMTRQITVTEYRKHAGEPVELGIPGLAALKRRGISDETTQVGSGGNGSAGRLGG